MIIQYVLWYMTGNYSHLGGETYARTFVHSFNAVHLRSCSLVSFEILYSKSLNITRLYIIVIFRVDTKIEFDKTFKHTHVCVCVDALDLVCMNLVYNRYVCVFECVSVAGIKFNIVSHLNHR